MYKSSWRCGRECKFGGERFFFTRLPKLNSVVRVLNIEKSSFYAHKISMIPLSEKLESLVSIPEVSTSRLQTLFWSSRDLKTDL